MMQSYNDRELGGMLAPVTIEQLAQQVRSFEAVVARFDHLRSNPDALKSDAHMGRETPQSGASDTQEDARAALQIAVQLLTYESNLAWSRFNALLVANGLVLSATGLFSTGTQLLPLLILPGIGVAMCLLLGIVINRGFDFHAYWEASACRLEERLAEPAQVVTGSYLFRQGQAQRHTLPYEIAGQLVSPKMSWKHIRSRYVANAVIVLFVVLYIVLFLLILFGRAL